MEKTLQSLLKNLPVIKLVGKDKVKVKSICTDSRRVVPGAVFFAVDGAKTDGNYYIEEAVHRGAVAVVSERAGHVPPRSAYVHVKDVKETLAIVARRFYNFPDKDLDLVGVTGTNGKTTVTTLLKYFLDDEPEQTGLIGTISYQLGRRSLPATRTTPDSLDLYAMFAQMRDAGCKRGIMEVSSHGIEQKRIHGISFKAAAFLNLTQDHLDYHGSMEEYFGVKRGLFDGCAGAVPEIGVINVDDPYGREILDKLPGDVKPVTFGINCPADFTANLSTLDSSGARFSLSWPGNVIEVNSPLLGIYNVSNVLAAIALGYVLGKPVEQMVEKLKSFNGVRGRMEKVDEGQNYTVLIDYAHTEDALKNALQMLREITKGRLLVVFGCGGSRDRAKRPLMTQAVLDGADYCWATSDNPRGESVEQIFEDMKQCVQDENRIRFVDDRRWAIHLALEMAEEGDTVLIAGKGHETFQEFADSVVPFDDRQVAIELIHLKQQ